MAGSTKPGPIGLYEEACEIPARTPGPLGIFDQGDPSVTSLLGDTPGPLGLNDWASPDLPNLFEAKVTPPGKIGKAPNGTPLAVGSRGLGGSCCPCTGAEKTTVEGIGVIPSYSGDFPSPLQVMWYVPGKDESLRLSVPDKEIRQWIKQAAEYHGVPHVLLAVILQQENGPRATTTQKVLQFGERSLTTFAAIMDEAFFDWVPDKIAGGSSGFANMSRTALKSGAEYSEKTYGRPPLPDAVKYRMGGWNQDTRISGDDWRSDLYYCAAHLRQLIDRVTHRTCHQGAIGPAELKKVIAAYNGSGPLATKYADDAMKLLSDAAAGKVPLYFYEE